ncbi:MAG: hypothetical protein MHM6MM_007771 [Cercozoa sp. M6MM]
MARSEVLELLASRNIVISGEQGDKLINSILDSDLLNGTDAVPLVSRELAPGRTETPN